MEFKKSINVKYDISDAKLINEYFATSSHIEIVRNVFSGVLGNKAKSHIAFGPYGAGKSFISTIITGFLSKKYTNKTDTDLFIKKFSVVDTDAAELFKKISKEKIRYIPVILNGYEGSFEEALTNSLIKQVSTVVDLQNYHQDKNILEIIDRWKSSFPETYGRFQVLLNTNNIDENEFISNLNNAHNLTLFKTFYKQVTSGSDIPFVKKNELINTFEDILDLLKNEGYGVILIYDEFGRMLQNIDEIDLNKFMQQLQDLAELANNQCDNLSLLFIAHKPISHYFSYLEKERRQEFSKIEKRFTTTSINSDNSTFINISSQIIKEKRKSSIDENYLNYHLNNLRKYKLFSNSFTDTEVENLIVRGCHPLHPATVFLLPLISKIFGQNERSLFSFILDESNVGVVGRINKDINLKSIDPDTLVDYFFAENSDISDDEIKELNIYNNNFEIIQNKVPIVYKELSEKIYKFIMLWSITNSNKHFNITPELISYSLNIQIDEVERNLINLTELNLLRYNLFSKSYELINSDYFDFDFEFERRKNVFIQNNHLIYQTLNKYNPKKVFYPKEHNNQFQLTRFANVTYTSQDFSPSDVENADFNIFIALNYENTHHLKHFKNSFILNNNTFENIHIDALKRLYVLDLLDKDRHFMIEHKNAVSTLDYERKKQQKILENFYNSSLIGNYIFNDRKYVIRNLNEIEDMLDLFANDIYKQSIIIQNDQINMFVISKQQENPTIKIIEMLLNNQTPNLDDLFIGNKPDHLIYYSLTHANLSSLNASILDYLEDHPSGSFYELTKIATEPPFGLRPTLSSLIVMYCIIDRWKNIMLFNNGNYIASIDAKTIYETGLGLTDFDYSYSKFDFQNFEYLNFLLENFPDSSEGVQNKSLSIKVLSSLNNWLISLPVITQLGKNISIQELSFIKYIQRAKVNPIESLNSIVNNFTFEDIEYIKSTVEISFSTYLSQLNDAILDEIKFKTWHDLVKNTNKALTKSNTLIHIASSTENVLEKYAETIDTLEIKKWPLAMFDMLKRKIIQDFEESQGKIETKKISIDGIEKEINDVKLSHKAENLKRNLSNLIEANSKYLTRPEVEKVVFDLINKFIN